MLFKVMLETGYDLGADPVRQARTNLFAPFLLLALAGRQWRIRIAHQIAGDGADVIGQVHVFGKAPDDAVGLRQGRAAFEYQVVSVGPGKEVPQRPDHPDVFLQQMGQEARCIGCRVERVQAFGGGELEELSHGSPGR